MKYSLKKGLFILVFILAFVLFGITGVYAQDIYVRTLSGNSETFDVNLDNDTIGYLKEMVATSQNVNIDRIKLIFAGNELTDDNKTFTEYNIQKESTIHLVLRNTYTITFNTNGGTFFNEEISEYVEGIDTMLPNDVEKDGYLFSGWYDNEGLEGDYVTEITSSETGDKEYWAKWEKIETFGPVEYTVKPNNNPNSQDSISFTALDGDIYSFFINDITSITDEQLQNTIDTLNEPEYTLESAKEQLNTIIGYGKKAAEGKGELLKIYELYLNNNGTEVHELEGGFRIKLEIADDMKGYDSYKLIYIADDGLTEDAIPLNINGKFLEGTLPHLSMYALVGSKNESNKSNPKTADNIMVYFSTIGLSSISLALIGLYTKKKKAN